MPGIADALTSLTAALHARHIRTSMARRWQLIAYPHPVPNVQDTAWLTGNAGIWYVGTWAGLVFRADAESDFTSFLDDYAQDPKQVLEELETRQGFHALNDEEVAQFDRMLVVQSESLPVEIQPCDLLLDLAAASIKVVTLGHGVWRLSKPSSDRVHVSF